MFSRAAQGQGWRWVSYETIRGLEETEREKRGDSRKYATQHRQSQ